MTEFINGLLARCAFPEDAAEAVRTLFRVSEGNADFAALCAGFAADPASLGEQMEKCAGPAEALGLRPQELHLALVLSAAETLHEKYAGRGISDDIFYRTLDDLRSKALECREVYGYYGLANAGWYRGYFELTRFALGRFQYEVREYPMDEPFEKGGFRAVKGDVMLNMHIPSHGPGLTREVRYDSYRRAYAFYRELFGGRPMLVQTKTWLLCPYHREMLPEGSNLIGFMDDFDTVELLDRETGYDPSWRIFGAGYKNPYPELPDDTALRRGYKKLFLSGRRPCAGRGYFFFDGEKIIR